MSPYDKRLGEKPEPTFGQKFNYQYNRVQDWLLEHIIGVGIVILLVVYIGISHSEAQEESVCLKSGGAWRILRYRTNVTGGNSYEEAVYGCDQTCQKVVR